LKKALLEERIFAGGQISEADSKAEGDQGRSFEGNCF